LKEYQGEDNELYNLEATPGEGTTYRFAKSDKENYPDIVVANEKSYLEKVRRHIIPIQPICQLILLMICLKL